MIENDLSHSRSNSSRHTATGRLRMDHALKLVLLLAMTSHLSGCSMFVMAGKLFFGDPKMTSSFKSATGIDWKERGLQAIYEWEAIHYLGYSRQWRDVPKPSIAAVQGQCIAGGLMLCWPCDLIVAADNAKFSDPVVRMGIGGVEYHGHTWEVGPRKAKEMLFTAESFTADEAKQLGMVNRVVPLDDLVDETMALAEKIAEMHPFALAQAKRAVNQTMDVQGFYTALQSVFDIHQTGHGNAMTVGGYPVLVALDQMKKAND